MKRFLLLISALMFSASVYAGGIKVKQGKDKVLKEKAECFCSIELDSAVLDGKTLAELYGSDVEHQKTALEQNFTRCFNAASKNFVIRYKYDNPGYLMRIRNLVFTTKKNRIDINGTIEILNAKTQEPVCVMALENFNGPDHKNTESRIRMAFVVLAEELAK